jgi:uncharacterized protein
MGLWWAGGVAKSAFLPSQTRRCLKLQLLARWIMRSNMLPPTMSHHAGTLEPQSPEAKLREHLVEFVSESAWFMQALYAVRELGLASWCIGAGAVRNLVWDRLHKYESPSALSDVDVAYFDASVLAPERDAEFQEKLTRLLPGIPWEVTNQASVHTWFESYFGHPVTPLRSLEAAVASWPEYATSIGVSLQEDNSIQVIAPYGLKDLFSCTVRRNPSRVSVETYRERVAQKRYSERWPNVKVVPC